MTNLPEVSSGNSQNSTDFSKAKAWLLALHQFAGSMMNKAQLDDKTTSYAQALLDDGVQPSVFTQSLLQSARRHFDRGFPSYGKLFEFMPRAASNSVGNSDEVQRMRLNNLAYAAANRWREDHPDKWRASLEGGYSGELKKWLVSAYFRAASRGEFAGSFEKCPDGEWRYELGEIPDISPGLAAIDRWTAEAAERRKNHEEFMNGRTAGGFKRLPRMSMLGE